MDNEIKEKEVGKNSVFATALSIISCIMGGGIVSIPYAFSAVGFLEGFILQTFIISAAYISTNLYLGSRSMLKCGYEFSDIAVRTIGSVSGILLNLLVAVAIFGVLTLYMILFSRIAKSIFGHGLNPSPSEVNFLDSKWFYVIILVCIQAPIVIKRRISELKFSTYILFTGVLSLLSLLIITLL